MEGLIPRCIGNGIYSFQTTLLTQWPAQAPILHLSFLVQLASERPSWVCLLYHLKSHSFQIITYRYLTLPSSATESTLDSHLNGTLQSVSFITFSSLDYWVLPYFLKPLLLVFHAWLSANFLP